MNGQNLQGVIKFANVAFAGRTRMRVYVIDRGFKRNLTQLTGRYDKILVRLCVLLNRASITEPFSATCERSG